MITKEEPLKILQKYPKGTKIRLKNMEDPFPVPKGTIGVVEYVDDAGTIHMCWGNGSSLGLVVGKDDFEVVSPAPSKSCGFGFIDFLANRNVVKVTNEEEFEEFVSFLDFLGIVGVLKNKLKFKDWQELALLNNRSQNCFLFEYDNSRGLTWSDNIQGSIGWYGVEPLTVKDL